MINVGSWDLIRFDMHALIFYIPYLNSLALIICIFINNSLFQNDC